MANFPFKPGRAIAYAILIWVLGFVWGSIVFMTPKLKAVSPIPFVSSNPAISFPILLIWTALTPLIARRYLRNAHDKSGEGLKLGITLAAVNLLLDLFILVFLLKAGFRYFASASFWLAYASLVVIPWITGKTLERK
jgi:hypothetical protein